MNIKYALVSSNENPLYYAFWPIVAKVWKSWGITPVLGLITSSVKDVVKNEDEHGIVIKLPEINSEFSSCLSQLARLYITKYLDGNCIISDIDLIPVDFNYFKMCGEFITPTNIVYTSCDHPQGTKKTPDVNDKTFSYISQIIMSYILGHSDTLAKIFSTHLEWSDWFKFCNNTPFDKEVINTPFWFLDQQFLTRCILNNKDIFDPVNDLKVLRRVDYTHTPSELEFDEHGRIKGSIWEKRRLNRGCRSRLQNAINSHSQLLPIHTKYIDIHFRPYEENKDLFEKLVDILINTQNNQ
jgi:hypothetical protein